MIRQKNILHSASQVYAKWSTFHSNDGFCLITEGRYEAAINHLTYSMQFDRKNVRGCVVYQNIQILKMQNYLIDKH